METGEPEEESDGDERNGRTPREPLPGGDREEGKRKGRRLSSQKQAEGDERNRKAGGKARKRSGRKEAEKKGSTGVAAVGAKLGRMKGNKQEAEYKEPGKKAWETRLEERGKP